MHTMYSFSLTKFKGLPLKKVMIKYNFLFIDCISRVVFILLKLFNWSFAAVP